MFKNNRIVKKIGAGFMAGLCAFSMLGTSMGGAMRAKAEYIAGTENPAFPTVDEVIYQAATLLGSPYAFGCKGFTGIYYQDSYKPLDTDFVRNQGIDCSGLVYYTLTHLGFKTAGFSWNNPVPVDTVHWLSVNGDCTITYDGVTTKVDVEKRGLPTPADSSATKTYEYWECEDGSTITPGSVVVANKTGIDHAWIYMGEFDSRDEVVSYLKNIGVPDTLITAQTVGSGNGGGGKHWRIESNGSQGVVINNNVDGKSSSAFECSAYRITQREVTFEIKKVYKKDNTIVINGTSPIDGTKAVYGVYTNKACTNKVGEITIGTDGTGSIKLPNAQYYVKEISAPTGYDLSPEVFALNANKQVFVTEEVTEGIIKINKTAEDGIVANREFKVCWTEAGVERYRTAVTDSKGIAEFTGLPVYDFSTKKAITYTISEFNVETRYETPKAQNVTLTSGTVDLTVTANFVNELKTGSIRINKQSEDNQNGDRTFTVTGNGETYTITTGADGIAILSDIPVYNSENEKIVYTISEKDVPVRYVTPANQTTTLTADATVDVEFENVLKKFTVEVVKKDIENGTAQGDASLAGAIYGIYNGDELIDTYTTDENGSFTTHEFECGENWTIKELTPSEGYLLDSTVYEVGAEEKKYTIENNAISMTVYETPVKGKVSIIKHSDDGSTGIETPEVGAEFEVYLKSAGSFENAKDSERDHLICDENGFAQTKMLPYGIYVVHQTVGWENTEWVDDFEVNVCENEEDYFYIINDAILTSYVKIVKKDAETGNIIPVAGIGFKVWNCDTESYVVQTVNYPTPTEIDTFYTDESGTLMLPNELMYGNYELHEVQSANGYVLDSTPIPFTIDGTVDTVVVEKENTPQKGKISVQKSGDAFASVTVLGPAIWVDEYGVTHTAGTTTYTPVFEETGLAGAVFEITAAEDIVTADGTIRAKAGELVATLTTDENGYAESDLLYLGKYAIAEVTAPFGYVKNDVVQAVELTYAGQEVEVRDTVNQAFVNDYQEVELTFSKFMERDELFGIGENDAYLSVRFGLFAAEDVVAADGTFIPADGMVAEVSLGEDMTAKFNAQLPFGRYYVQEIATDEHYMLSDEKFPVTISENGDTVEITAENKAITVEISKQDIYGAELAGAEMQLMDSEGNVVDEWVSDGTNHVVTELPVGKYVLKEVTAPDGYVIATDISFEVFEDGSVVAENVDAAATTEDGHPLIVMVDDTTKVEISKRDITTDNELAGATLQIIDDNCNVVEEWVSTDKPHYIEAQLIAGKTYTLTETAAPDGYKIANSIDFTVKVLASQPPKQSHRTSKARRFVEVLSQK